MAILAAFGAAIGMALLHKASAAAIFPPALAALNQPDDFLLRFDTPILPDPDVAPARLFAPSNDPFAEAKYTTAFADLDPCAVISAHTHPRSSEINFVAEGVLEVQMFLETGETVVTAVQAGEGVVIPDGTIHVTRNPGCTPLRFFAQLDHPVGGAIFTGLGLSQLPEEYLQEAFLGPFPDPQPVSFLSESCLQRCGLAGGAGGYGAVAQAPLGSAGETSDEGAGYAAKGGASY